MKNLITQIVIKLKKKSNIDKTLQKNCKRKTKTKKNGSEKTKKKSPCDYK